MVPWHYLCANLLSSQILGTIRVSLWHRLLEVFHAQFAEVSLFILGNPIW